MDGLSPRSVPRSGGSARLMRRLREGEKRGKKGEAELRVAPSVGAQGYRQQQGNCTRELNGPTRPARAKPDSQQPHHGETKHEVGRVAPFDCVPPPVLLREKCGRG